MAKLSDKFFKGGHARSSAASDKGGSRQTENCMVCGEKLQYHEKAAELSCSYCRRQDTGHIVCPNGHYICEQCHNQEAMRVIEDIVFGTDSQNPAEIAELAFSLPGLPMLGCPHAYIAGGAFMAALKNNGAKNISNEEIKEVFQRTGKQAHGGYCGLTGVCGIAPALGACISVLTGSKCGKDKEQRLTMELVTRVSRAITDLTGPSCCKAYVRASLKVAVDFLQDNFAVKLPMDSNSSCRYMSKHPHGCLKNCPYFPIKKGG